MKILAAGFWGAVVAVSLSACGSKSSGGDCPNAAACGGDITGTWKITSSCLTLKVDTLSNQDCPDEKVSATDVKMSGTITYGADMTYNSSVTVDVSVTLSLPSSCLMQGGITLTCAQVQQALTAQADSGVTSATCSAAGSGCSCKLVSAPEVQTDSGTYTTTASGTLSQKRASSTEDDLSDFCVKGSTLTLSPHGSTMMGSPTVTGSVALTKQ